MKKEAFTLIELLVVIAVISLLMAILMPALRKARDQGRRTVCISNVRTLTMGWYMYQGDNDSKLVNGNVPRDPQFKQSKEPFWVEPPQNKAGLYRGDSDPTLEDELRGIQRGALYTYTKTVDVYRCPSDDRKRKPDRATFRSFSIAGGMNGETSSGSYTVEPVKRYLEIRSPITKYVFVEEGDPRDWNMGSWILFPTGDQWIDVLSIWHGNRSTLGWADGHAEIHRWVDKRTMEMSEAGEFMATHPDSEDLKFMQRGYQYQSLK